MRTGERTTELTATAPNPVRNHFNYREMEKSTIEELGLKYDTPLAMMTLGQLLEVFKEVLNLIPEQDEKSYIHGLRGIQQLFGVSHKTAQAWKNTWLAPACSQLGKTIIIDRDKAVELFEQTGRRLDSYGL